MYSRVKEAACGPYHTIILSDNGKVYSSGNNSHGQLGNGTKKTTLAFQKVSFNGDQLIQKIASGSHSCAISENGQLYLWGTGAFGEFLFPQKITGFKAPLIDISVGSGFGLAIDSAGNAYSWGSNKNGELGLGDYEPRFVPTQISALQGKKVTAISCGNNFVMGLGITIYHKSEDQPLQKTRVVEERNASMRKFSVDEQVTRDTMREDSKGFDIKRDKSMESCQRYDEKKSVRNIPDAGYKSTNRQKKDTNQIYTSYNEDYKRRSNASSPVRDNKSRREDDIYKTMDNPERYLEEDSSDRFYLPPKRPTNFDDPLNSRNNSIQMNVESQQKVYKEENSNDGKYGSSKRVPDTSKHYRKVSQPESSKAFLNESTRDLEGSRRFSSTITEGIIEYPLKKEPKRSSSLSGPSEDVSNPYRRDIHEPKRNTRNEILAEENERLIRENVHMDNENGILRTRIRELEEKMKFKERIEDNNYHEKAMFRKFDKIEASYRELEAKYKDLETESQNDKDLIDNLRKELHEEKAQNSKLIKALEENHNFMKSLEEENKELLEKQSQLNEAYDYCKERDFYKRKYEEVQKRLEKVEEDYNNEMKEKENIIDKLNDDASNAKSAIQELNEALKQISRTQDKERNVLTQCEKERDKYYEENQQLKSEVEVLITKLEKLESQKETVKVHNDEKMKAYNQM